MEDVSKVLKWLWDNGHKDKSFKYAVVFIVWVGVLSVAQIFSYRAIKINFFEIPFDKIASSITFYEPIELIEVFPYKYILLPVVLLPVEILSSLVGRAIRWSEEKDWYALKTFLKVVEVSVPFITVFLLIYWLFESDPVFANWVGFGLLFFGLFQSLMSYLFDVKALAEKTGISVAGLVMSAMIMSFVVLGFSTFLLQRGMQSEGQRKGYVAGFCDRLSLVSVATNATRIGWLLARDEKYFTMREKMDGVYHTTDTPTSEIKQIIYLERFGGGYIEKIKAFPGCDISNPE